MTDTQRGAQYGSIHLVADQDVSGVTGQRGDGSPGALSVRAVAAGPRLSPACTTPATAAMTSPSGRGPRPAPPPGDAQNFRLKTGNEFETAAYIIGLIRVSLMHDATARYGIPGYR